jgi:hypothetical protein
VIGAGSVVTRDVGAGVTVAGNLHGRGNHHPEVRALLRGALRSRPAAMESPMLARRTISITAFRLSFARRKTGIFLFHPLPSRFSAVYEPNQSIHVRKPQKSDPVDYSRPVPAADEFRWRWLRSASRNPQLLNKIGLYERLREAARTRRKRAMARPTPTATSISAMP